MASATRWVSCCLIVSVGRKNGSATTTTTSTTTTAARPINNFFITTSSLQATMDGTQTRETQFSLAPAIFWSVLYWLNE